MGTFNDRVLDAERGFRTPAFDYDALVAFETYGEDDSMGVGRVVGLVVADALGYRSLSHESPIEAADSWGYMVEDTGGVVWLRTAYEMEPLGASGL